MMRIQSIVTLAVLVVFSASSAWAVPIRTVAISGGNLRSVGGNNIVLNDQGDALFYANLQTPSESGYWVSGGTGLTRVFTDATPVPDGGPTDFFEGFSSPIHINNQGDTAAKLGDHNQRTGFWTKRGGLERIIRHDEPVVGEDATFQDSGFGFVFNNAGVAALRMSLDPNNQADPNESSVFRYQNQSLSRIVRTGESAPGSPAGSTFTSSFGNPVINDSGIVAFGAEAAGPNISHYSQGGRGVWKTTPTGIAPVAITSQSVPDLPPGTTFGDIATGDAIGINSAGHVVFQAYADGWSGVFKETTSGLETVAIGNMQAPGMPTGVNIGGIGGTNDAKLVINDQGETSFFSRMSGPGVNNSNDLVLWSEGGGQLSMVAREGDLAPGPAGALRFFGHRVLNTHGQIAFYGSTLLTTNLYAQDASGQLQHIVGPGDMLEVAPGDFRTVRGLPTNDVTSGNADGRSTWFNDQGQLLFSVNFTDNSSGVFIAEMGVLNVPEPATATLAIISIGLLARAYRRRKRAE